MARQALILTERDILEIDLTLVRLLKESEAKCALLVDQDGRMLARKGFTKNIDCEGLAALLAGSFASNKAIANLVGEPEFSIMFHQGDHDSIQNNLVDDDTILCVIFDERTTIGMVRVYAKEAASKVAATLASARSSNLADDHDYSDVQEEATAALDSLFGGGDDDDDDAGSSDDVSEAATALMPSGGGRPPEEDTQPHLNLADTQEDNSAEDTQPQLRVAGSSDSEDGDAEATDPQYATTKLMSAEEDDEDAAEEKALDDAASGAEDETMADVFLNDLVEEAEGALDGDATEEDMEATESVSTPKKGRGRKNKKKR